MTDDNRGYEQFIAEKMSSQQPYFENSADFQFKIIDPDAKSIFKGFREINKDIVTANLNNREINLLLYGDSIVGVCDMAEGYLDDFQTNMCRDIMMISNTSKGRNGFLLRRITEHNFIKTDSFKKNEKNIGGGGE
jgi:hypothetical protein